MKREITRSSLSVTLRLVSDTEGESASASPSYGGERHPSIISQRTREAQLLELLNCLERKIEILEYKYLEDFATSRAGMENEVLVPLYDFTTNTTGTDADI